VQDKLAANRQEHSLAVGAEAPSLLAGLIVDAGGHRMTPVQSQAIPLLRFGVASGWRSPLPAAIGDIAYQNKAVIYNLCSRLPPRR
jgi:hypothetical protein